jgi:hypothetical protein
MAFRRIDKDALLPGRWALNGRYGDGKSTIILALREPAFIVDVDGRRHELKGGELYELSEEAADTRSVEQIHELLNQNTQGFGIKAAVIDRFTPLIGSSIACAMLDNAADETADSNQAWVVKAAVGAQTWDMLHGFNPRSGKRIGARRHERIPTMVRIRNAA